jgi:hypothetical protein
MFHFRVLLVIAFVCALAGCSSGSHHQAEIGEAFAGPATLKLRKDIDPHSAEITTVSHGDRLGIINRRRRFVKVRTSRGIEGWTDLRQLLASEQMEDLNKLAERAQALPSQGAATVFEALNAHTEPNRLSPSFYRIKEGEAVDVVAHELVQRVPFENKAVLPPPAPRAKAGGKKKEEPRIPRAPMPPAPKLPDNWLELSKSTVPAELEAPEPETPAKPTPLDDWTLVRLKNGRAGWVLTASLKMNIPDEVAQYSEGRRITSYFAMADINDNGQMKHHWLWTTISNGRVPYEFDSFRYFIWSSRKHHYETAYVERNLKGYFPVEVRPVRVISGQKSDTFPGFSLVVEQDGVRYRKTYAYEIYLVRLVNTERLETPAAALSPTTVLAQTKQPLPPKPPEAPGLYARLKQNLARLKARWFGK